MRYLLDTDTCIQIIRHRPEHLLARLFSVAPGDAGISSITAAELAYGVHKSRDRERNARALEEFLLPIPVMGFDDQAAAAYGQVRAALEALGQPIGSMDMLIGAHALALSTTLVTNNVREFSQISGLQVENWWAPDAHDERT